ncbi:hypothetical protein MSAN_01130600 [Mycena sanguinolenta]|uniref:Alpha-type protein kinase domain-containing protein n=1 Tax=Mycena sanguinolenta TaxID=230812 RepID=A0A8H6YL35_9AGAR|nr:hypothetical protein MSAN_01130600 [Mycena sanguinolenta]
MKPAKTGGSTRIFSNKNPAKLYLAIDNPTFDKIADFFEKLDNPDRDNLSIDETSYPPKKGKKAMTQRKPRTTRGKKSVAGDETEKSENQDALDMSQSLPRNPEVLKSTKLYRRATPPPGPVQKKPRLELMVSPDASNIKKALAQQSQPRTKALKGLFDNTTCDVLIYILPTATWTDAIKNPHIFSELKNIIPCHNVIYYNTKSQRTSGGFKTAIPGKLGTQIFDAEKRDVCLKQAFSLAENGQKVIHAPISQLSFLGGELNILGWATTMMDIVYRYIKIQEPDVGTPPFHVPVMRFVRGGLAICQNETKETYLVEEWIDGEFVKYIHNRSGQPHHFQNGEYDLRARFLSFCQHVQFYKTDKAAYVSDFQGGLELLTDPQIISDPDLGITPLFGDGNTNYAALAKDHHCNEFCDFYRVPKAVLGQDEPVGVEAPIAPRSITPTAKNEFPPGLSHVLGSSSSTMEGSKLLNPPSSNNIVDLTGIQDDTEDLYA